MKTFSSLKDYGKYYQIFFDDKLLKKNLHRRSLLFEDIVCISVISFCEVCCVGNIKCHCVGHQNFSMNK